MSLSTDAMIAPRDRRPVPFRETMQNLAGGVAVITAGDGDERTGMTATSVSSFSADPPTIVLSVNRESSTWRAIRDWRCFCVNILSDRQQRIAENFAGGRGPKGVLRYREGQWMRLATGAPVLSDAIANLDCDLDEAIERHSHALVIGRVRAVAANPAFQPLLYWRGAYLPLPVRIPG